MILKARAEKGALSSAARSSSRSPFRSLPCGGRDVEGARQVGDDGIEHGLDALVLERSATKYRDGLIGNGRPAQGGPQVSACDLLVVQELLRDPVVESGHGVDQVGAPDGGLRFQGGGYLHHAERLAPRRAVVPDQGVHFQQVHDAGEVALHADRQLYHGHGGTQTVLDHVDAPGEVGPDTVHLVDKTDAGHAVLVGLAPYRLGLRLDARDSVENGDGPVEDAERPLDLNGEVDVAGRVDDVDAVVVPQARGGGRCDRDAPLLLLGHPVHRGAALVDLTHLVVDAGVVQDALGRGRLARVDVSHDPDVAGLGERELSLVVSVSHWLFASRSSVLVW